jgi:hypothetical protein
MDSRLWNNLRDNAQRDKAQRDKAVAVYNSAVRDAEVIAKRDAKAAKRRAVLRARHAQYKCACT